MNVVKQKREMRIRMRQEAAKLSNEEMRLQADDVFAQIEQLEQFKNAEIVALFWSMSDEIPTHDAVIRWAADKCVLLPCIEDGPMYFRRYTPGAVLEEGPGRTLHPVSGRLVKGDEIDLMIVPGVAFDRDGGRLGRGKGYYDDFFAETGAFTIGVCMKHQLVDKVPREDHDRKVDKVVFPVNV